MEYLKQNKKHLIMLAIAIVAIIISSFFASMIQSAGYKVKVTDLRNATNSGKKGETTISGKVVSGILFMPKDASETNKLPAVVLTHGYLNNRELQLQNAIELARRGFIVLTVDREGHGNYESSGTNAMMATNGLYDSAKYLYNLPEVDQSRIGISGHSMGGFTTAMTLMSDMATGIVKAGLMQGWSSFMGAGPGVSVGFLKAQDDEFFFTSKLADGTPSISRQFLQSQAAASFVGVPTTGTIDVVNGGIYIGGQLTNIQEGTAASSPFRVVYESSEIHPLNHFSVPSAGHVVNFFYTAFGTPAGHKYIASTNQTWWVKETFSLIGLIAFFFMLFPLVSLLLELPWFKSLKRAEEDDVSMLPSLKQGGLQGILSTVLYFAGGLATMLFGGFVLRDCFGEKYGNMIPQNEFFPQDTTGSIAAWGIVCAVFALCVIALVWIIKAVVAFVLKKQGKETLAVGNPFACIRIDFVDFLKTIVLAFFTVIILYAVVWANWDTWVVDFRIWTLDVHPFLLKMVPMMLRYIPLFFIFYAVNALGNAGFRLKDLPEWATVAINAFFNAAGVLLVILIQYITFRSTGVLWQGDMALGYIVVFPMVAVLAIATIISRYTYKRTGNIWLGAMINAILMTVITCANTAASYPYAF